MRISMSKLIAALLLILVALMPTAGVMSQEPTIDANGVVSGAEAGPCAGIESLEPPLVEGKAPSLLCFSFTNPTSPTLQWYVVIVPQGGSIVWGRIVGTICSGRWDVTGGRIGSGPGYDIYITAVCAGNGCSGCASNLEINVTRTTGLVWAGTYVWDGSTTYSGEMQLFRCPFGE